MKVKPNEYTELQYNSGSFGSFSARHLDTKSFHRPSQLHSSIISNVCTFPSMFVLNKLMISDVINNLDESLLLNGEVDITWRTDLMLPDNYGQGDT